MRTKPPNATPWRARSVRSGLPLALLFGGGHAAGEPRAIAPRALPPLRVPLPRGIDVALEQRRIELVVALAHGRRLVEEARSLEPERALAREPRELRLLARLRRAAEPAVVARRRVVVAAASPLAQERLGEVVRSSGDVLRPLHPVREGRGDVGGEEVSKLHDAQSSDPAGKDQKPRTLGGTWYARCTMDRRAVAMLGLGVALAIAPGAGAQEAPPPAVVEIAAEHFAAGERAFAAGDFLRAAEAFEAAHRAAPQPAALWNAARSWHKAGEVARAANLYRRYLRDAPEGAADRDEATRAMVALGARLGRLDVVAPGAAAVSVDGQLVESSTWFVNPGTHLVSADLQGARVVREVSVEEGGVRTVVLEPPPAVAGDPPRPGPAPTRPPAARPVPKAEEHGGAGPWLFGLVAGTTALSAGLTIASGVDTLLARNEYLDIPEDERTLDLYDQGKFKQDRTNVMIGVTGGLALVSAAVAVFAIDWGQGTLVGLSPGGARAHVTF